MEPIRDPSQQRIAAWAMLAAPFVIALISAVVFRHPAAYVAVAAGLAALIGGRRLCRVMDRDLTDIAAVIESNGVKGGYHNAKTALLSGREVIGAASRVHRELLLRGLRAEAAAADDDGVLESLHDPLLLCDSERRVTRANRAARELFGVKTAGRNLAAAIRAPDVLAAVDAVLAGGDSRTVEFVVPTPVERIFEARIKPFSRPLAAAEAAAAETALLEGGEIAATEIPPSERRALLVTLYDITALRRSEQTRADFVANASHELRTPLSSLIGFIETLRGPARGDADAYDRFLAIMADQAGRMSRLVNDLLSLSRIELDEHMPPVAPVAPEPILRSVLDALELKARDRGMTLRLETPETIPDVIGDADQIAQVAQNLVTNAIKYGKENTEVVVRVAVADGGSRGGRAVPPMLAVAVADRGDGIPRTHLPRLTERFYRVDAARSRAMGGTGLGLAIVKHIMNRHRGRLTIDSAPGAGSTFTVHFPVAMENNVAAPHSVIKP
jgi:two-component system, OmpR family, phosphate regulon sensor histidine kinase PhoR